MFLLFGEGKRGGGRYLFKGEGKGEERQKKRGKESLSDISPEEGKCVDHDISGREKKQKREGPGKKRGLSGFSSQRERKGGGISGLWKRKEGRTEKKGGEEAYVLRSEQGEKRESKGGDYFDRKGGGMAGKERENSIIISFQP